jgi:hypothetical protein
MRPVLLTLSFLIGFLTVSSYILAGRLTHIDNQLAQVSREYNELVLKLSMSSDVGAYIQQ